MPKAARAATMVAFLIAVLCALNLRSGPIMLLGICLAALLAAAGLLQRKAWAGYGFASLAILSILANLFFAVTGQNAGSFIQVLIGVVLYGGLAGLFLLAGHMLSLTGAKRGTPIPWLLLAALFFLPFVVFQQITMPSNAMEDTLLVGDFLLVDRSGLPHPAAGDLVAFHFPLDRTHLLVRRIVGLPGDRIHFVNGTLYRNGAPVTEPYVTHNSPPANESPADILVPSGKYFVLGDSRANSLDSRQWGLVDSHDILGKPRFIYDSLAPDPADIKLSDGKFGDKYLVQPGPLLRRWDRVFKKL